MVAWLLLAASANLPQLYRDFRDPPRHYTVRPFWFWNGKLDSKELAWQIDQMVEQGVYGAYVHNRTGLETPYLSEEYFQVVGAALEHARRAGFRLGFVDEYEWPSGEARDVWLPGLPSRVLAANPEFRMRRLAWIEREVTGPARFDPRPVENLQFAVAGDRLVTLPWDAPPGRHVVYLFHLVPAQGRDGGLVDLLNPAAIRAFLDLTYEQYYKRFASYFGSTIDSFYADHEGDYGPKIAWTPALLDTFQRRKGYDLRPRLPLLLRDGPGAARVRIDYHDVISHLYQEAFFSQVTRWCEAHGVKISGHLWEETLQMEADHEGDLARMMRAWSWPGVDSLFDRGRLPRDFKVAASVAHFRGTRFTCENQGLQGNDSFFDLQKARLGTNMIAAWGVNLLIPHAFNYHRRRIEYPPDWFYHQPWWKYFRRYADYARRLSFMNDGGAHVADILVYHPLETAWAGRADDKAYTALLNRLAQDRWDYDVADSYYLLEARIEQGRLVVGNESFRVLIVPPGSILPEAVQDKIRRFQAQGGLVLSVGELARHLKPDVGIREGELDHLFYQHRRKEGVDFYWLVNDSARAREFVATLRAPGAPEKWDAETGAREPLEYRTTPEGTEARLRFDPWDAYYVVLAERPGPRPRAAPAAPLPELRLEGPWQIQPGQQRASVPGEIEQDAVREWELAGPFPNPDHQGFRRDYAPERWTSYTSPTYFIDLEKALRLGRDDRWVTAYARARLHSPAARAVQVRVAADNNAQLWVNGQNLLDWHIHPFYYEMRDEFALGRVAELRAGWNEILVKVTRCGRGRRYAFLLRVVDPEVQPPEARFEPSRYQTEFTLPPQYLGRRLTLDLGPVHTAAEVEVNGRPAGVRVWLPYTYDISKLVRPGVNRLSVLVTGTSSSKPALGPVYLRP
jgi:hypothetical protein